MNPAVWPWADAALSPGLVSPPGSGQAGPGLSRCSVSASVVSSLDSKVGGKCVWGQPGWCCALSQLKPGPRSHAK